ncbi:MAG TPA: dihydrofolate reductase [Chitinophagales bacterium]|nr:dihydrofolate reductase [Chitinophagales bacterium]
MVSIIAAASENNVIGKDNQIPWRLPADMRYFKSMTKGHVVVMGRKTFESLGKPLAGRVNIVITRKKDFHPEGVIVAPDIHQAMEKARQFSGKEIFIIGGGEIYRQSLHLADRIYLTRIHRHFDGDTFFPDLPPGKWKIISEESHQPDEKNPHSYSFITYRRIS